MSALISETSFPPFFSSMTGDESSPPRFTSRAKSSLLSSSPLSIGPLHKKTAKKTKRKKHFHCTGNVAYARLLQLPGDVSATRYERGGRGPVTQRHLDLTGIHNNGAPRTANENNKKRKTK
jgi:hypothetical protein